MPARAARAASTAVRAVWAGAATSGLSRASRSTSARSAEIEAIAASMREPIAASSGPARSTASSSVDTWLRASSAARAYPTAVPALTAAHRLLAAADGRVDLVEQLLRLVGVAGDRRERHRRVGRGQRADRDARRVEPLAQGRRRAGVGLQGLLDVGLEVAQLVEAGLLRVEHRGHRGARPQDARGRLADLRLGVGDVVVERLAQPEGLGDLRLRVGEHGLELAGGVGSELRLREPELLVRGLDGVVDRDERGRGAAVQLGRREGRELVAGGRCCRVPRPRRPGAAGPDHAEPNERGDDDQADDEHRAEAAAAPPTPDEPVAAARRESAVAIAAPAQSSSRSRSSAAVLAASTCELDRPSTVSGASAYRRASVATARMTSCEPRPDLCGGRLRPLDGVGAAEVGDVDDVQLERGVLRQLVERRLDLRLAAVERADLVGDLPREGQRADGRQGTGTDQERGSEQQRDEHGQATSQGGHALILPVGTTRRNGSRPRTVPGQSRSASAAGSRSSASTIEYA